jgi:hypothetical protein
MILVDKKHEYDYEVDGNRHILRFSDNGDWTFPKKVAMEIFDDGNGLKVDLGKRINYAEAEQLLILLKLINKDVKYEIVTDTKEL